MCAAEAAVAMRDSSSGLICFRVVMAAVLEFLEVDFERLLALAAMAGMVVRLTDQSSVNTVDCYCYLLLFIITPIIYFDRTYHVLESSSEESDLFTVVKKKERKMKYTY